MQAQDLDFSAAQKQLVEITKVLSYDVKLVVMDEPTSSLTTGEVEKLFAIIGDLKKKGITFIYISHKLDEIFRLADHVTVVRDGRMIETRAVGDFTHDEIIERMVGRSVTTEYPRKNCEIGEVVLRAENITREGVIRNISFELHRGEILGFAGLVGSGRTELAEAIFGAEPCTSGTIEVKGRRVSIRSTSDGKGTPSAF